MVQMGVGIFVCLLPTPCGNKPLHVAGIPMKKFSWANKFRNYQYNDPDMVIFNPTASICTRVSDKELIRAHYTYVLAPIPNKWHIALLSGIQKIRYTKTRLTFQFLLTFSGESRCLFDVQSVRKNMHPPGKIITQDHCDWLEKHTI